MSQIEMRGLRYTKMEDVEDYVFLSSYYLKSYLYMRTL